MIKMTLKDIIDNLESIDDSLTICAALSPIYSEQSEAELIPNSGTTTAGKFYLLEVFMAKMVLEAWSHMRQGKIPNAAQRCEAIIHYGEYDCYFADDLGEGYR